MICARIGRIRHLTDGHSRRLPLICRPPGVALADRNAACPATDTLTSLNNMSPHGPKPDSPAGLAVDGVGFVLRPIKTPLDSTEVLREHPGSFRNEGSTMEKPNRSITERLIFAARGAVLVAAATGNERLVLVLEMSALALEYRHVYSGAPDRNGNNDDGHEDQR